MLLFIGAFREPEFFVFTSDILCSLEILLVYDNIQEIGWRHSQNLV